MAKALERFHRKRWTHPNYKELHVSETSAFKFHPCEAVQTQRLYVPCTQVSWERLDNPADDFWYASRTKWVRRTYHVYEFEGVEYPATTLWMKARQTNGKWGSWSNPRMDRIPPEIAHPMETALRTAIITGRVTAADYLL